MKAKHLKCHYCTFRVTMQHRNKGSDPKNIESAYEKMNEHMEKRHQTEYYIAQRIFIQGVNP